MNFTLKFGVKFAVVRKNTVISIDFTNLLPTGFN